MVINPYDILARELIKLVKDRSANLSPVLIRAAYKLRLLNEWEYEFYYHILGKARNRMTKNRVLKRDEVNYKVRGWLISDPKVLETAMALAELYDSGTMGHSAPGRYRV
jgi:hypothetical protein